MDKDQLINKPEINIVGVIVNHRFNWYVCSNDMWTMDIDKYIQSYKEAGWDLDFSYLPEIQQNLHVVTKRNIESYLDIGLKRPRKLKELVFYSYKNNTV